MSMLVLRRYCDTDDRDGMNCSVQGKYRNAIIHAPKTGSHPSCSTLAHCHGAERECGPVEHFEDGRGPETKNMRERTQANTLQNGVTEYTAFRSQWTRLLVFSGGADHVDLANRKTVDCETRRSFSVCRYSRSADKSTWTAWDSEQGIGKIRTCPYSQTDGTAKVMRGGLDALGSLGQANSATLDKG